MEKDLTLNEVLAMRRDVNLNVRISRAFKEMIKQQAKKSDVSATDFIFALCEQAIRQDTRIIKKTNFIPE